jgi:hypothetical protein
VSSIDIRPNRYEGKNCTGKDVSKFCMISDVDYQIAQLVEQAGLGARDGYSSNLETIFQQTALEKSI